jgi:hypothetical protein
MELGQPCRRSRQQDSRGDGMLATAVLRRGTSLLRLQRVGSVHCRMMTTASPGGPDDGSGGSSPYMLAAFLTVTAAVGFGFHRITNDPQFKSNHLIVEQRERSVAEAKEGSKTAAAGACCACVQRRDQLAACGCGRCSRHCTVAVSHVTVYGRCERFPAVWR